MLGISGSLQRLLRGTPLVALGGSRSASRPPRAAMSPSTEIKASRTGSLVAFEQLGEPVWSPRDYGAFAREGFMQNAILYRSVRMIAEAAASIPLILYEGDREIESHPLLDLIRKPSYDHTGVDFLESWYGFLLVSGNAYVEAVNIAGVIRELHILRPDRMKVIPGPDGWPEGYEYTAGGQSIRFTDEVLPGVRPILHVKMFHPVNDHYGMSPIEAAAVAIDIHNEASKWNKALLDNSARPSGALVYAAANGQMTGEQFQRLKDELEASYQGAMHAGRPLLLEGGLDWKPLSLTPKDMDFIEAKNSAAREIALALGVPPMLLGIPGDNTYSNYAEAQRAFWRQTVLPLVNRTARAFSHWLAPSFAFGDSPSSSRPPGAEQWSPSAEQRGGDTKIELRPDLDQVEALNPEREALWARLNAATFLSEDEKRAAAGYRALGEVSAERNRPFSIAPSASASRSRPEGTKYRPDQPRLPAGAPGGGQWTDGGGANSVAGGSSNDRLDRPVNEYRVDLETQDRDFGGHTIRDHVNKSDQYLLDDVRDRTYSGEVYTYGQQREGTFLSTQDAHYFVNECLARNRDKIDALLEGGVSIVLFDTRFGFSTGKEAYRLDADAEPYIRPTYVVRVVVRRDDRSPGGFKVFSTFPINEEPKRLATMQEFGAFKVLASAFFQGSEKEYADQTEWIRSRIAFLNAAQQSEVKALLDELLSGNYSDDQLHVIWKEGKSCYLFPGKNLRVFLAVVRDAIDF